MSHPLMPTQSQGSSLTDYEFNSLTDMVYNENTGWQATTALVLAASNFLSYNLGSYRALKQVEAVQPGIVAHGRSTGQVTMLTSQLIAREAA